MKRLIPIASLALLLALCVPAGAAVPDLVGPGLGGGSGRLPAGPIVATSAAAGFAAWVLALLRRKKRAKAAERPAEGTPPEPPNA